MNLTEALHPVDVKTFFAEYWNRKPLLVRRDSPAYYESSLAKESPESLLLRGRLRYPEVRLVRQGVPAPPEVLAQAGLAADSTPGAVKLDPVRKAYADGYTLVIRAEMSSGPVAALCRTLALEVRFPFFAELFCTPRGSQGSNLHHDPFDVFILQVSGRKHWKVYAPSGAEAPNAGVQTTVEQVGPLLLDDELGPGDLLYVPRPFPHVALTTEGFASTHLSLAGRPWRWRDLVQEAVDMALQEDLSLHESVPYDYLTDRGTHESDALAERLQRILGGLDASAVRNRLGLRFVSRQAALDGHFLLDSAPANQPTETTLFRLAPGVQFFIARVQGAVQVAFPGELLTLPLRTFATLQAIQAQKEHSFSAESLRSNLDAAGRLVLLRRLSRSGAVIQLPAR